MDCSSRFSPRLLETGGRSYETLEMKALRFFETLGYVKLFAAQRNVRKDQNRYPTTCLCP